MSTEAGKKLMFGPFEVTSQVFLTTPHSFALVNLKPLLPGHVLVCPAKPHKRLTDLSQPEVTDLFTTVQRVQRMLARHYFLPSSSSSSFSSSSSSSGPQNTQPSPSSPPPPPPTQPPAAGGGAGGAFNIALQDGPEAGQTVPHVHVHIIPRVRGLSSKPDDGTQGDALYDRMAGEEGNVGGALWDRRRRRRCESESERERPRPGGRFDRIEDSAREARTMAEMEAEAEMFRGLLRDMEAEEEEGEKQG